VNASYGRQPQGYSNNAMMGDPSTRSPAVAEGGPGSTWQSPANPQGTHGGNRNVAGTMGQQLTTASQQNHALSGQYVQEQRGYHQANDNRNLISSGNICRIPNCAQPRFFHPQVQEQLDYCERHWITAMDGFAATCRHCRSLPVLGSSQYCSRRCSNAAGGEESATVGVSTSTGGGWTASGGGSGGRGGPVGRVQAAAMVPTGFAPACQECRRPITEGEPLYYGSFTFCSRECLNAYISSHSWHH